ncbi:MAG: hypothetical protein K6E24_00680 [bacterium]|nr:hypothetical protein [bacterium]
MKCKNCGYESKNLDYCPICGEPLEKEEEKYDDPFEKVEAKNENTTTNEKGYLKAFAIIGYVLGIVSLCLCWMPFVFIDGIAGIIFSKLGCNSISKKSFAKKGLVLSIISAILGFILTIIIVTVICMEAKNEPEWDWYNYIYD